MTAATAAPTAPIQKQSARSTLPTPNPTSSFWLRNLSPLLHGYKSTAELPDEVDVVIVGSGITGAGLAWGFLGDVRTEDGKKGKDDLSVCMLEAREVCSGATGRNGGHSAAGLYPPSPATTFELRNHATVRSLIQKHSISCEWRDVPGCHAYYTVAPFTAAKAGVERLHREHPELKHLCRVVEDEAGLAELRLRVPGALGAVVVEGCASLAPYGFVSWVVQRLVEVQQKGKFEGGSSFNLQTNTPVTGLAKLEETGLWTVQTPRGVVKAKKVVLATNAYTSFLLPEFADLIMPVRAQMSVLKPPAEWVHTGASKGNNVEATNGSTMSPITTTAQPLALSATYNFISNADSIDGPVDYLIQRPFKDDGKGGQLMFGGGRIVAAGLGLGVSDDSSIDETSASYLRRQLYAHFGMPQVDEVVRDPELESTHEWTGIIGESADLAPWVGPVPGRSGVWIVAGFSGHGMPNAWLCGQATVEMVRDETRNAEEIRAKLVKEGNLPEAYYVDLERMKRVHERVLSAVV